VADLDNLILYLTRPNSNAARVRLCHPVGAEVLQTNGTVISALVILAETLNQILLERNLQPGCSIDRLPDPVAAQRYGYLSTAPVMLPYDPTEVQKRR
jgi:hypothetical protein